MPPCPPFPTPCTGSTLRREPTGISPPADWLMAAPPWAPRLRVTPSRSTTKWIPRPHLARTSATQRESSSDPDGDAVLIIAGWVALLGYPPRDFGVVKTTAYRLRTRNESAR